MAKYLELPDAIWEDLQGPAGEGRTYAGDVVDRWSYLRYCGNCKVTFFAPQGKCVSPESNNIVDFVIESLDHDAKRNIADLTVDDLDRDDDAADPDIWEE